MQETHEGACEMIWRLWQAGEVIDGLPADLKPATRAGGYAIQAGFERLSSAPRAGWKIAATSSAGQHHIGVDGPLAGRLLAERLHGDGAILSLAGDRMRVCEPEFAFRFGRGVPVRTDPRTVDDVLALVSEMHLTLELPDSRFTDFATVGGPSLIADNACAHELIVGPAVTADWRGLDLATHEVHARVGERYVRDGVGANVLGDPREALAWCVNELSGLGIGLRAGELITTGTCTIPLAIEPGDRVLADFGVLGEVLVMTAP